MRSATGVCITPLEMEHNRISVGVNGEEILISTWHAKAEKKGSGRSLE
jgi:hypothetical protein